jgi:hypothetical protein
LLASDLRVFHCFPVVLLAEFLQWAYLASGGACLLFALGFGAYRLLAGRHLGTSAPPKVAWQD